MTGIRPTPRRLVTPLCVARIGVGSAALASLTLMSGCSAISTPTPSTSATPGVTVTNANTAQLTERRQAAGVPDCSVPAAAAPVAGGLPAVTLPCLGSDRSVTLSALRGRPMLVNLWAQWCEPCKREAPTLASFATRHRGAVDVWGIDYADPDPLAALAFAGASRWTYPQLADPDRALAAPMALAGIPVTLLVDADGRVVYRKTGPWASAAELDAAVAQHLGVKA